MSTTEKKRKTKGTPDYVDVHVGKRLRIRRSLLGLSQEKLAEAIGLTFQQIQKYERGTNRVSAGRLYQFSKILDVPVSYFYEQIGESVGKNTAAGMSDNAQQPFGTANESSDLLQKKETLDLLRVYYAVKDENLRKDIYRFVKSMSDKISS